MHYVIDDPMTIVTTFDVLAAEAMDSQVVTHNYKQITMCACILITM